jgi:hypothetical protein
MLLLLSVDISVTGSNASHYYATIFTSILGVIMVEKLLANQAASCAGPLCSQQLHANGMELRCRMNLLTRHDLLSTTTKNQYTSMDFHSFSSLEFFCF